MIESDAFGALIAELRRVEASHHSVDTSLQRLNRARGFADADDSASAIHHRLANATVRPAGSGRIRYAPRLIAGLISRVNGVLDAKMRARSGNERP
ncbi:hypothetical protein [Actinomyces sp. oral taxon 171]|uniref:hypothetical protein n=1 Tax=Actinomyces sp. oral taxon 171 TaxID=706438 RepID=UPI0001F61B8B|nr:hypothetical protein [Actinomyces sp. oral taxon 171]EFW26643.1 hypothetical protein HMPREF9057_01977 [Actinomyces sp. oral taxon 171 str. F0337]QCT34085.1 hypothetical protein FBF36_12005 [Actinomyces sp. oral taxon 171 str. F0337]